jgi:hypothetical protein
VLLYILAAVVAAWFVLGLVALIRADRKDIHKVIKALMNVTDVIKVLLKWLCRK